MIPHAGVVELIFLEFAAKIIGIEGVESEEGMARLRGCALPIFGGLSAAHFEDRQEDLVEEHLDLFLRDQTLVLSIRVNRCKPNEDAL